MLEGDLGLRRAQPAVPRDDRGGAGRRHRWIEELVRIAEEEASCEVYGLLKRPDEKYVTERAYDNPKFVEDLIRDVVRRLNAEPAHRAYVVEVENFESIHNHSAYARIDATSAATPERRIESRSSNRLFFYASAVSEETCASARRIPAASDASRSTSGDAFPDARCSARAESTAARAGRLRRYRAGERLNGRP